jgi:hypothetical protein
MATRIYLPSTGAAAVTPTNWLITPAANNYTYAGVLAKISSAFANRSQVTTTANAYTWAVARYVLGPLDAVQISGTVEAVVRCYENNAQANCTLAMGIHIIQANGANRSTLLVNTHSDSAAANYEFTTTLSSKRCYTTSETRPPTLSNQTPTVGDYLVIELGFYRVNGANNRSISINVGDNNANDLPNADGDANAFCPWVEFSGNIGWYAPNNYNLSCDPASFSIGGEATTFLRGYSVDANANSYAITGQAATLTKALVPANAEAGTYAITGVDATREFVAAANAEGYAVTGQAVDLNRGRRLDAEAGAYNYTGQTISVGRSFALAIEAGIYTHAGHDATFVRHIPADIGAYAYTGQDATFAIGRAMPVDPGAYLVTGQPATFPRGWVIAIDPGAYNVAGEGFTLVSARVLPVELGSYAITGLEATRRQMMSADPGTYLISGQDCIFVMGGNVIMSIDAGTYTVLGPAVDFLRGRAMPSEAGSYGLTGLAAGFARGWVIIGDPGTYSMTGRTSDLLKGSRIDAGAGAYLLSGQSAQMLLNRIIASNAGTYAVTGPTLDLLKNAVLDTSSGLYVVTGEEVTIAWGPSFVVPLVIHIDGRKFIRDLDKRLKIARLEASPKIRDVDKRR